MAADLDPPLSGPVHPPLLSSLPNLVSPIGGVPIVSPPAILPNDAESPFLGSPFALVAPPLIAPNASLTSYMATNSGVPGPLLPPSLQSSPLTATGGLGMPSLLSPPLGLPKASNGSPSSLQSSPFTATLPSLLSPPLGLSKDLPSMNTAATVSEDLLSMNTARSLQSFSVAMSQPSTSIAAVQAKSAELQSNQLESVTSKACSTAKTVDAYHDMQVLLLTERTGQEFSHFKASGMFKLEGVLRIFSDASGMNLKRDPKGELDNAAKSMRQAYAQLTATQYKKQEASTPSADCTDGAGEGVRKALLAASKTNSSSAGKELGEAIMAANTSAPATATQQPDISVLLAPIVPRPVPAIDVVSQSMPSSRNGVWSMPAKACAGPQANVPWQTSTAKPGLPVPPAAKNYAVNFTTSSATQNSQPKFPADVQPQPNRINPPPEFRTSGITLDPQACGQSPSMSASGLGRQPGQGGPSPMMPQQFQSLMNDATGPGTDLASAVAAAAEQAKRIAAEAKASAAAKVAAKSSVVGSQAVTAGNAGTSASAVPPGSQVTPQSPPGAQMFLGGVPKGISEGLVLMECAKFGEVASVSYHANTLDAFECSWAIIRFTAPQSVPAAVQRLSRRTGVFGSSQPVDVRPATAQDLDRDEQAKAQASAAAEAVVAAAAAAAAQQNQISMQEVSVAKAVANVATPAPVVIKHDVVENTTRDRDRRSRSRDRTRRSRDRRHDRRRGSRSRDRSRSRRRRGRSTKRRRASRSQSASGGAGAKSAFSNTPPALVAAPGNADDGASKEVAVQVATPNPEVSTLSVPVATIPAAVAAPQLIAASGVPAAVGAGVNAAIPTGGRQVSTRGEWAEFALLDGRSYYVHIITGEKNWARPMGFENIASRRGATGITGGPFSTGTHSNVYVGSLPAGINDSSFRQLFCSFGTIVSTKVVSELHYGFVKYTNINEAQASIDAMNGVNVNGLTLQVRFANKQ